jgi:hypothetical protein
MWRYVKFVRQISGSDHHGNLTHKSYRSSNNSSSRASKKDGELGCYGREKVPEIDLKPTDQQPDRGARIGRSFDKPRRRHAGNRRRNRDVWAGPRLHEVHGLYKMKFQA